MNNKLFIHLYRRLQIGLSSSGRRQANREPFLSLNYVMSLEMVLRVLAPIRTLSQYFILLNVPYAGKLQCTAVGTDG